MAKRTKTPSCEEHKFYCLLCGREGIPLLRKTGFQRGSLHRKKLYCPYCKVEVNHIEIKTTSDGGRYATMEYVLEKFDEKDFKKILTMLDALNNAEEKVALEENKGAD